MTSLITPLIVCGGSGTRLWPASRADRPKQFLPLFGPLSTFQETVRRVADPELFERPLVVTNRKHRFAVAEQLEEIEIEADILLEPEARDSGPAIAAGVAAIAAEKGNEAAILSLAADHMVRDAAAFRSDCRSALKGAQTGCIVTFGIKPSRPAPEYGYIEPGDPITNSVRMVRRFVEKPDVKTAEDYLRQGFLWNSGNFLFLAGTLLREYDEQDADTVAAVAEAVSGSTMESGFRQLHAEAFGRTRKMSIDHAVLERTTKAAMLLASFDWSDVGSWSAVRDLLPRDADGNATKGHVIVVDARNNMVSTDGIPVALVGLENVAIIATPDAILVANCAHATGVKDLVDRLKSVASPLT
jgi:mannose-1-phosphate guanylyltransferase/mannose-6-phosphate isomerase